MSVQFIFDWKFVAALGGSVVATIFSARIDKAAIEKVSIHLIDSAKEYAVAYVKAC